MTLTPTASSRGERSPNPSQSRSSMPRKKHERCAWCPRNLRRGMAGEEMQGQCDLLSSLAQSRLSSARLDKSLRP